MQLGHAGAHEVSGDQGRCVCACMRVPARVHACVSYSRSSPPLVLLLSSSQMPTDAPEDRLIEQEAAAKVGAASSASSPPLCSVCVCVVFAEWVRSCVRWRCVCVGERGAGVL